MKAKSLITVTGTAVMDKSKGDTLKGLHLCSHSRNNFGFAKQ
jgi:hypothetical protein